MHRSLTVLGLLVALASSAQAVTVINYASWDGGRQKADELLIAQFNKANPDLQAKYNLVPWDLYWQKAAAMVSGGSTFDVMWMDLDNFPFYRAQGALAPLTVSAATTAAVPRAFLAPYVVDGKTYGLPLGPQAISVFINRALFRERGVPIPTKAWTYAQMLDAARKLTFTKQGKQYYGINANDLQINGEYGMSFVYSAGGQDLIRKEGSGYVANLDSTFVRTAQKLNDLIYVQKVSPRPSATSTLSYQTFLAGQMGIYIEGTWNVSSWAENPALDWAFAPFPSEGGRKPSPVVSVHALVIPSGSRNRAAAQRLVTWMTTSAESQRLLAEQGLLPTQYQQFREPYLQVLKGRNAQTVFDQLPNSRIMNVTLRGISNLPEVLSVLQERLNLAWTGNTTVPKAVAAAAAAMNDLLKQSR